MTLATTTLEQSFWAECFQNLGIVTYQEVIMGPLAHLMFAFFFAALVAIGIQVGLLIYVSGVERAGGRNVECVQRQVSR